MARDPQVLEYFLCCQICSKTFTDPVSLECNHSFCKICVCEFWDQDENRKCPICQMPASKDEPQVNVTLKGVADMFAGRIQENNNTEPKPEVMCRLHMQGTHIHMVNPMWICKSEGDKLVCEGCEGKDKHAGHRLVLLREAVEDMKQSISLDLCPMKQQARECKDVEDTYVQMEKHLKVQQEQVEKKIKEEFEELHQFLRNEEEARLTAIREEAERKRKIVERELKIIRGQIHFLTKSICRVEVDLKQDTATFYQDRKHTMEKVKCKFQDPHMVSDGLIDVPKHLGNLKFKVWKRMMDLVKYFPVILDPNTADGWLSVSEDMTTVWEVRTKQDVPDNTERFTKYIYVLGSEGYTSGKHCWEVDVGSRKRWSLGVAKESIERKEETFLEPRFGFWTIWMDEFKCTVGGLNIHLDKRPEKVRIQLDYEKGELSFHDANEMTYIHAYRTTFTDKLYPFFSTETDESAIGISICPLNLSLIAMP